MPDAWVRPDYSLVGDQGKLAVEQRLKPLMKRSDGPAIRDTMIWFAAFVVTGGAGYLLWGMWRAVAAFLLPMASFPGPRPIHAGTNAGTAPPSRRAG